jgi:Ca2+-binding RTX toxin-like protein
MTIPTTGPDNISGTPGNDNIDALGGNDNLTGGAGNDRLVGGDGNDQITGGEGNDAINGGAGNDFIRGDFEFGGAGVPGNDTLNGGDGSDRLFGGGGNDTFVFMKGQISNGTGLDQIIDFQGAGGHFSTQDFIQLKGFGVGSTFTYTRDSTGTPGATIWTVYDSTDGYTAQIMLQFADASGTTTGPVGLRGGTNGGSLVSQSDFGWFA